MTYRKDRERWRAQLSNRTFPDDFQRIIRIAFEMEGAINKMDEENTQLRQRTIDLEAQFNKRIQELHQHYSNQQRGKTNSFSIQNQIQDLSKQNVNLMNQCKKFQAQAIAKDQELIKIISINKSNGSQYQNTIAHIKSENQRKSKQNAREIINLTAAVNKANYQCELQIKKLNDIHQRQITKIHNARIQIHKQRQQEIRNQITMFYERQIAQLKQINTKDIESIQNFLRTQNNNAIIQIEKQQELKLAKQTKVVQDLKSQVARIKKIYENAVTQNSKRIQAMRLSHIKQTNVLNDKFKEYSTKLTDQSNSQVNKINSQLQKKSAREIQLIKKNQFLTKQLQKTVNQKLKVQQMLEVTKNQHQKRTINIGQSYQNNLSKIDIQNKSIIQQLQIEIGKYNQANQHMHSDLIYLESQISKHQTYIKQLQQDNNILQKTIQSLKYDNQRKVTTSQSLYQKNIDKVMSEHKSTIQKLNNDQKLVVENLRKDIQSLNSINNHNLSDLAILNDKNRKLQIDIKLLKQQAAKSERQIKKLNELVNKRQKQIQRLHELKQNQLSKINDLHDTVGLMVAIEEVNRLKYEHNHEIQQLQRQLWQIHQQMNKMVPNSQLQKLKYQKQDEKKKLGQNYNSIQFVLSEVKKKLEDNERGYKQSILEMKNKNRQEMVQIMAANENKILQLKSIQTNENQKRNIKNLSTMQQVKQQMKEESNQQIGKLKEQHRRILQDLNNQRKRQVNQLKNEIINLKTKNSQMQKQIQYSRTIANQQKEQVLGKIKNDEISISSMKSKLDQYDIRQKKSQMIISQLQLNLKELEALLLSKQKQYQKQIKDLQDRLIEQSHDKQLQSLKKQQNATSTIQSVKQNYQNRLRQQQKKQANQKRSLNQRINTIQMKIVDKDKEIQRLKRSHQDEIQKLLYTKDKKDSDQKIMQRKIQDNIEEIMQAKNTEFNLVLKELQQKNNQYLQEIIILQTSNQTLRQQITSSLARGNKQKQLYEEINRLKSQLSNAERRTTQQLTSIKKIDTKRSSIRPYGQRSQNYRLSSETSLVDERQISTKNQAMVNTSWSPNEEKQVSRKYLAMNKNEQFLSKNQKLVIPRPDSIKVKTQDSAFSSYRAHDKFQVNSNEGQNKI